MEGPPLGPGREDITWPDQVAPRGRKGSGTRKIKPQTSNLQMDLKLKPEFEGSVVRRRPYPASQDQIEEIQRQIQECIDAGLVEEYKHMDYHRNCSPYFLVLNLASLPCAWSLTTVRSTERPRTTQGGSQPW